MCLAVPPILRRGATKDNVFHEVQSTTSLTSSSSVVQVGILPQFLDQCRSITFKRFVLKMVKVTIFGLGVILNNSVIQTVLTLKL